MAEETAKSSNKVLLSSQYKLEARVQLAHKVIEQSRCAVLLGEQCFTSADSADSQRSPVQVQRP